MILSTISVIVSNSMIILVFFRAFLITLPHLNSSLEQNEFLIFLIKIHKKTLNILNTKGLFS